MAQPHTQNPYPLIGSQIKAGLTAIIAALPPDPTIDDLVNEVYSYVQPLYYENATTQVSVEIKSVAYHVINSYRNNLVLSGKAFYNVEQFAFILMLIGNPMTSNLAPDSFADRVADIEDNVGTSDLTVNEQIPLYLATMLGKEANSYWVDQLKNPQSAWLNHFSTNSGENYMNSLLWSVAAMNGALAGYGATNSGLIEPTVDAVTTRMVSALIGGLIATAGKLIFNWIPRITKPLNVNVQRVTRLTGSPVLPPKDNNVTSGCINEYSYTDRCHSLVCGLTNGDCVQTVGHGHAGCISQSAGWCWCYGIS